MVAAQKDYSVREPSHADLVAFYAAAAIPNTEERFGLYLNGELVALSGILPDPLYDGSPMEAETIGFLDVRPGLAGSIGIDILCRMRGWLKARRCDIWVQQDDKFSQSTRLLRALGFIPTHRFRRDFQNTDRMLRMWVRPVSEK